MNIFLKMIFYYLDGSKVERGQKVLINKSKVAYVREILEPKTQIAHDYACPEGGILLEFPDGDMQAWPEMDEDIKKY